MYVQRLLISIITNVYKYRMKDWYTANNEKQIRNSRYRTQGNILNLIALWTSISLITILYVIIVLSVMGINEKLHYKLLTRNVI
jgi:hypothetical protein